MSLYERVFLTEGSLGYKRAIRFRTDQEKRDLLSPEQIIHDFKVSQRQKHRYREKYGSEPESAENTRRAIHRLKDINAPYRMGASIEGHPELRVPARRKDVLRDMKKRYLKDYDRWKKLDTYNPEPERAEVSPGKLPMSGTDWPEWLRKQIRSDMRHQPHKRR